MIAGGAIALLILGVILLIRACTKEEPVNQKETQSQPQDQVGTDGRDPLTETDDPDGMPAGSGGASGTDAQDGAADSAGNGSAGENAAAGTGSAAGNAAAGTSSAAENSDLATISAESVPDERSFTLSAVGDCTLGMDKNFNYDTSFNAYAEEHGLDYFFENVRDVLAEDDLTIANLECTFTDSTDRNDKTYAFKAPPSYAKMLTGASIEACNLANNHSNDYGSQSYTDTIENVEALGIPTFGYDRTQVIDVNGVKVGLVGYLELWDEYDTEPKMLAGIEKVKEEGAEVIIVTVHWGTEKEQYPDSIQQYLGHSAIDHGAHLVLGHHPHRIQGIEIYKGRAICYSLANFCFGGNRNPSDMDTFIFRQTFTVKDGVVQENEEYETIPCSISSHSDYNDYKPRVLEGESAERVLDKISERSEPFTE